MNRDTIKKVADWLGTLGSHDIYAAKACAEDFTKTTGEQPCWPVHSAAETRRAITKRGLGGTLDSNASDSAYGYEIAEALAEKYANRFRSGMMGRGSLFRDCFTALEKAATA